MQAKYYAEYDEIERTWDVYESDGGRACDKYLYDVFVFACATKEDAETAVKLLNKGGET